MIENNNTGIIKNFTLTAFLSFVIIFCLFVLLSTCSGDYKVPNTTHHSNETELNNKPKH